MRFTEGSDGAELSQLQREYRNMELNRKVYADESYQVMRRQQCVIENLRKDNEKMKAELSLAERHIREGTIVQRQEQVARLQEQIESYNRKNVAESKRFETLTQQIQVMRHKVLHQKKHMGGVNAARENQQLVGKQIRILENRLDKSLVKFNETLAHNKVLREEIDSLRRERGVFDTIYRKLEREYADKKRQMAHTIELSNEAYEQRDTAQLALQCLQDENRAQLEAHRQTLSELMSQIEENNYLDGSDGRGGPSGNNVRGVPVGSYDGDMSVDEEDKMKRRIQKWSWGLAKEKIQVQVSGARVQTFEDAFEKLKVATGIEDLDQLVTSFIQKEDENFSLFNYVNGQSHEIKKLEEWIAALDDEERQYTNNEGSGRGGAGELSRHQQVLRDLETRLTHTQVGLKKYESRCAQVQETVDSVKRAIHNLFTNIGCDANAMIEMLGDAVVTETNMIAYLGIIEKKTNEILHQYATSVARRKNEAIPQDDGRTSTNANPATATVARAADGTYAMILGVGPITPMNQEPLQIDPPSVDDYSSEDEDYADHENNRHPLARDELKLRTFKNLHRLNNATASPSNITTTNFKTRDDEMSTSSSASPLKYRKQ